MSALRRDCRFNKLSADKKLAGMREDWLGFMLSEDERDEEEAGSAASEDEEDGDEDEDVVSSPEAEADEDKEWVDDVSSEMEAEVEVNRFGFESEVEPGSLSRSTCRILRYSCGKMPASKSSEHISDGRSEFASEFESKSESDTPLLELLPDSSSSELPLELVSLDTEGWRFWAGGEDAGDPIDVRVEAPEESVFSERPSKDGCRGSTPSRRCFLAVGEEGREERCARRRLFWDGIFG